MFNDFSAEAKLVPLQVYPKQMIGKATLVVRGQWLGPAFFVVPLCPAWRFFLPQHWDLLWMSHVPWFCGAGVGRLGKGRWERGTYSLGHSQHINSRKACLGMLVWKLIYRLCACVLYILWQLSCIWRSVPTRICCVSNQFCGFIIKAEIFLPLVCVCVCMGMHVHKCVSFRTADQGKSFLLFRVLS